MIEALLLVCLVSVFLPACRDGKRVSPKESVRQHFQDISSRFLPRFKNPLIKAVFAQIDESPGDDLVLLTRKTDTVAQVEILVRRGRKGFVFMESAIASEALEGDFRFVAARDLNADGADDLILITGSSDHGAATVLFNNKKGYFYSRSNYVFPFVRGGTDKVYPIDLDYDGDVDLFFTGSQVRNTDGTPARYQAQVFINNGNGDFEDATNLLMPPLAPGVTSASFADYDGDLMVDVFLTYGNGQNRLLLNNGLGQFSDATRRLLPDIRDQSLHADWADFDQDGDNDLLVGNRNLRLGKKARNGETSYFLENDGNGRFRKKSHSKLPRVPIHQVYLLDANGTNIPDAVLLTPKATYLLTGMGNWEFFDDSQKRLPSGSNRFLEMTFADISRNQVLDIFGVVWGGRGGRLWLNRFK